MTRNSTKKSLSVFMRGFKTIIVKIQQKNSAIRKETIMRDKHNKKMREGAGARKCKGTMQTMTSMSEKTESKAS